MYNIALIAFGALLQYNQPAMKEDRPLSFKAFLLDQGKPADSFVKLIQQANTFLNENNRITRLVFEEVNVADGDTILVFPAVFTDEPDFEDKDRIRIIIAAGNKSKGKFTLISDQPLAAYSENNNICDLIRNRTRTDLIPEFHFPPLINGIYYHKLVNRYEFYTSSIENHTLRIGIMNLDSQNTLLKIGDALQELTQKGFIEDHLKIAYEINQSENGIAMFEPIMNFPAGGYLNMIDFQPQFFEIPSAS